MKPAGSQRDFAVEVVTQLRKAGYEALWAGGCVRDQLLGIDPKDYDVATSARPEQIRELFGRRRTLAIGAAFGVISVLGRKSYDPIEVATFRSDGKYLDGRHPESVSYTTAEHDAERRDFTINGLFFDPIEEKVIDYVGGEQDLRAGLVRAIRDPSERFAEDKLRMLRAIRFAATFDFEIDPDTFTAIQSMSSEISSVSAERIGMELKRMLLHKHRDKAAQLLRESGLLVAIVPALAALDEAEFQQTLEVLARLREPSLPVALAALLCQEPDPEQGPQLAKTLRFTNKEAERTGWLLANATQLEQAEAKPWPAVQRMLVHPGGTELVDLYEAQVGYADDTVQFCRQKLALPREVLNPEPLLAGADLIEHGVRPGPRFKELLTRVRDAQLLGEATTREQALALIDQWLDEP